MSYPSNNPWDKDRFGYDPPRASRGPLIVVLVVLALLGVVVAIVGVAVTIVAQQFPWGQEFAELTPELDTAASPHAQDWQQIQQAFSTADLAADKRRIARLEQLLNEFLRCSNEDDHRGLRKVVDYPRFFREMRATRFRPIIDQYDRSSVVRNLIESVRGISGWQSLRVVRVEKLPHSGEVLVYAHGYHADGYSNPARFWVVDRGRPLVFDWEMTEYGSRETGDWSVYYAYAEDRRMDAYYSATHQIDEAEGLWAEDKLDEARAKLNEAASARVPPVMQDQLLLYAAYTYLSWNEYDEVAALVERMISPEETPGAHMVAAQAHQRQGDQVACLAAIEKFETALGITPQSIAIRVECLEAQEDWTAAADEQRRVLQIMPDDAVALRKWGLMLGEAEKQPLVEHVRTLADPVGTAKELAQQFAASGDVDAALALGELLRQHPEHALWVEFIDGCTKQADADYTGAAAHFHKVLSETDDDTLREQVEYRWYEAMSAAKQYLQAYQQAPDPQAAFDYFIEGYEEDESSLTDAEFAALVAAHREKAPDYVWGFYYASLVASNNSQADEAARLLREGLAMIEAEAETGEADAYVYDMLRSRLLSVLVDESQSLEAYAMIPPAGETFRTLANLLRHDVDRTDELKSLIDKHAAAHPHDGWLPYYRAILAQRDKRFDDANRLLADMQQNDVVAGDEELARAYRYLRIEVLQDADEHLTALRDIEPTDETFGQLARDLQVREDWTKLDALIEAYEARPGADVSQCIYWGANLLRAERDDAALVELLYPWPEDFELETWEAGPLRSDVVAALVRLGRCEEAREFAQRLLDEDHEPWQLVRVSLACGDREEAIRLIDLHRASTYRLREVYDDALVESHIWSADFAELRQRHPPGLSHDYAQGSAIVLYDADPTITTEHVHRALAKLLPADLRVVEVPPADDATPRSLMLTATGVRVAIAWGSDQYQHDSAEVERQIRNEVLRNAWRKHTGWMAVDVFADDDRANTANKLAGRIAARLDPSAATLMIVEDHLLAAGDDTRELLDRGWTDDELIAAGPNIWTYREADDEASPWNRRRSFRELDKLFHTGGDAAQCFVEVELQAGHAVEKPWLRLVRVIRPGHRERSFVAAFVEPSTLDPHFAAGEHVRLEAYEIANWKRVAGEQTTFGRDE